MEDPAPAAARLANSRLRSSLGRARDRRQAGGYLSCVMALRGLSGLSDVEERTGWAIEQSLGRDSEVAHSFCGFGEGFVSIAEHVLDSDACVDLEWENALQEI
jgi:hypothetical protein